MDDDIIVTLKRSNDLLITFGNDYSDVFLPAIDEIEQLRKVLKDVLETSEEQIPYGTVKAIRTALKEKERIDIVERLREFVATDCCSQRKEAADEIEQLRKDNKLAFELMDTFVKEINRLKQVLYRIASMSDDPEFGVPPMSTVTKIAQDALDDD